MGLRVLVVDDETATRELLKYVLDQCECVVEVAAGAEQALSLLRERAFDLLISDIGLPSVDGYALIRSVRALPTEAGPLIPAVALTAYARSEDRTTALRAGFDVHLTKPHRPGRADRRHLDTRRGRAALRWTARAGAGARVGTA